MLVFICRKVLEIICRKMLENTCRLHHSRFIVGGELFYNDSAANFQHVFKDAVATYGIPSKLYTDHGAAYDNEQLDLICGAIGCVHLRAKVRDGASKAKIERFWRTSKEGLYH